MQAERPISASLVYVDDELSPIAAASEEPVANLSTPESIAVLIYTSGSTGQPKGACIPHRAAVRLVRNTNFVRVAREDRVAQVVSPFVRCVHFRGVVGSGEWRRLDLGTARNTVDAHADGPSSKN